jgi:hypothetical protein
MIEQVAKRIYTSRRSTAIDAVFNGPTNFRFLIGFKRRLTPKDVPHHPLNIMGHSFVDFRDRTQMMHDIEIITVVHIILDVTRQTSEQHALQLTTNIKAMLDSWSALIDVYGPGTVGIDFNEFVHTDDDRDALLRLIELARQSIQRFGAVVPAGYMNRVIDAPAIFEFDDRPMAKVLAAFDKFIKLLGD